MPKPLNSMFGFGLSSLSIAFICLNPILRGVDRSRLNYVGGHEFRRKPRTSSHRQRCCPDELSPIPRASKRAGTDIFLHGVFNLLCTNPKNHPGDSGSPVCRYVGPHPRGVLIALRSTGLCRLVLIRGSLTQRATFHTFNGTQRGLQPPLPLTLSAAAAHRARQESCARR